MFRLTDPWPLPAARRPWLTATAVLVLVLALLAVADASMSRYGQALPGPLFVALEWITLLGDSVYSLVPALAVFIVAAVLSLVVRRPALRAKLRYWAGVAGFVFVGVGLPGLFTVIVKRLIGRARPVHIDVVGPFDLRPQSWLDWTYQSFPSGHATTAFALCFVVAFMFRRSLPPMLVLAVLVALSRVVVGAHYPSDVLAGAVVGTLGAYAVRNFFAARGWVFMRQPDGQIVMPARVRGSGSMPAK